MPIHTPACTALAAAQAWGGQKKKILGMISRNHSNVEIRITSQGDELL